MPREHTVRWGLLATGHIARRFAQGLADPHSNGRLVAAGSRTQAAAEAFGRDFAGCRPHGSYESLLRDPEVDAVYISTPHPMHAEWAIKAAEAGKHVLCEKPLTLNHAEAAAVVDAARRHKVFLMEAFMYRCHPQTAQLVELIREGTAGEVRLIDASFGFRAPFDPGSRLFDKSLGGGAILDVGCYTVSMVRLVAGIARSAAFLDPISITGAGQLNAETGADEVAVATLDFGGILAQVACATALNMENCVRVHGTEAIITIPTPWLIPRGETRVLIHRHDEKAAREITINCHHDLYALEAASVADSLQHPGRLEAHAMPHDDTLGNMRALDAWRAAIGLRYEMETREAQASAVDSTPPRMGLSPVASIET